MIEIEPLPHHYSVSARADSTETVELTAEGLPPIESAPPAEFGGPGGRWSPESLFVAAVVDCFVLSFRAIARASKLEWTSLDCRAEGTLDRIERVTRFVGMPIHADLELPPDGNLAAGQRLLEKAEKSCLISNSLALDVDLETNVTTGD